MSALDFALSAAAVGPGVALNWPSPGRVILEAVQATRSACATNTNLGILLLCVPLAFAHQQGSLLGVWRVIRDLDLPESKLVYDAIRLANPGGLGDAPEQDVRSEPTVTLLEAMKLAADRDLIARQYANNYADVFDLGVPAFTDAFAKYGSVEAAVIACQLAWMAAFPDSLIARKRGLAVAEDVQRRVRHVLSLGGLDTPAGRLAGVELDAYLRSDGNKMNPGTTADLVAACLFVALRENKVTPSAPFRWNVPDWL
jgi:triphosphoribosyl-dephospho-CoA synthase